MLAKIACNKFVKALSHVEEGSFDVTLPDGRHHIFEGKRPGLRGHIEIRD